MWSATVWGLLAALLMPGVVGGSAQVTRVAPPVVGMHVPWAVGGQQWNADHEVVQAVPEWPDMPVQALRLWDTRTTWANLEPARGVWEWGQLDANLAEAHRHGVTDIDLVLWGTPSWAASSVSAEDAPWIGPGSASVPVNLEDWDTYVRTVVLHCKGQVFEYEIGNEPTGSWFYRGSPEQLALMVAHAADIVHEVDPGALVLAPAPAFDVPEDVEAMRPFWAAMAASGARLDVLTFHWYPKLADPEALVSVVDRVRQVSRAAGMPELPVWVTEVGFHQSASLGAEQMRRLPSGVSVAAFRARVARVYWYAWTVQPIGDLLPLSAGTQLAVGLRDATTG